MSNEKKTLHPLEDEVMDAVLGGVSLYEDAAGMDRDSWFASLIKRMLGGGSAPVQSAELGRPNGTVPLTSFIVGEYSKLP